MAYAYVDYVDLGDPTGISVDSRTFFPENRSIKTKEG